MNESDIVEIEESELMPAIGTAIAHIETRECLLSDINQTIRQQLLKTETTSQLPPLFSGLFRHLPVPDQEDGVAS